MLKRFSKKFSRVIQAVALLPIKLYQYIVSPLIGPCCRFHPSCSEYSKQAIIKHGVIGGIILTGIRLLKCQPWYKVGELYDPIPETLTDFFNLNKQKQNGTR